ncbi:MAG: hypothetical protein RSD17_06055 [Oscillospiraceae bacterium]
MIDNTENTDIEKQSNSDFYKDMLKSYILGDHALPQLTETELERYIAVFSLYLRHSNEAYKYNLPYLSHQYKGYASFLISASEKAERLRDVISHIINSETIIKIIEDANGVIDDKKIIVSLNDFLTATLSGSIDFHKTFSISGANRKNENDIITIEYKQQVRTVKLSTSKQSDLKKIISAVEKIVNNSLKDGGEK